MENDGDLADIVRASMSASGGGGGGSSVTDSQLRVSPSWHVQRSAFLPPEELDSFGNPFSHIHDPLLHELDLPSSGFFNSSNSWDEAAVIGTRKIFEEDTRRPTNNIFSRMLQISPSSKMSGASNSPRTNTGASTSDMIMASPRIQDTTMTSSYGKETIARNPPIETMQISPRNPGIKRRKSQAKKVVCIPAPAAANSSRTSGEVVPSDLWAWRKYGQKPIKGSPYPRGYYRCSSSKGCSARKQVERSRTDPNMLVITYTSEHNHPWPTQRNALAGSTRSQPPKSNAAKKTTSTSPQTASKLATMKEEQHQEEFVNASMSISVVEGSINVSPTIKQELRDTEKSVDVGDKGDMDSFFADLGELEYDPLNLLFNEYNGEKSQENKAMDPFSLFDWAGNSNVFEENKRGGV